MIGGRTPGRRTDIQSGLFLEGKFTRSASWPGVVPAIVDAVVVADEMPNLPHIDLEQAGHYAVAKIKEAVLAVTGG
jgi:hypothetical protein